MDEESPDMRRGWARTLEEEREWSAQLESLLSEVYTISKEALGGTANWSTNSPMHRIFGLLNQQDFSVTMRRYTQDDVDSAVIQACRKMLAEVETRLIEAIREDRR